MKLATQYDIDVARDVITDEVSPQMEETLYGVCETAEVARKLVAELRRVTRYGHQPSIVPCLCRACALLGTIEVSDE